MSRPPGGRGGCLAAAKGLEWPVVALIGVSGRARDRHQEVRFEPELGLAVREDDDEGGFGEPALYTLIQREQHRREQAEELRLIYVGITRARDHLLLGSTSARSPVVQRLQQAGIHFQALDPAPPPSDERTA